MSLHTTARSPGRLGSVAPAAVQALLCTLLVVPFAVLTGGSAHAAPPYDTPFLTWNMQGATALRESLWTSYMPGILDNAPPNVVMLQEAGADVPHHARVLNNPPGAVGNPLDTYAR
ncbi:hypothetical protein [Streptomyces sp. NPDC090022]|uniref:hypothetical protein n=1 Tax=Streptomyces sp. NPDC090022 TaxID=3365920 RepID=UPI00380F231C